MPMKTARSRIAKVRSQFSVGDFLDGAERAGQTGVVEHDVEFAVLRDRARDRRLDRGFGSDVGQLEDRVATVFLALADGGFSAVGVEVGDNDVGAFAGEASGGRAAHAAGGARDDRDFPFESAHDEVSLVVYSPRPHR